MALSVGMKLMSSVLNTTDITEFSKLNIKPEFLKPLELDCYQYIQNFIYKHKTIPQKDTVISELGGLSFPIAKEVPSYYANQVRERYISDKIKTGFTEVKKHLQKESLDISAGVTALTNTLFEINIANNSHQMVDFKHAAPYIGKAYKDKKIAGLDGSVLFGYPYLDHLSGGMIGGDLISIIGRPACSSGHSKLYVVRGGGRGSGQGYTLEELYRGFNGGIAKKGNTGGGERWDLSIPTYVHGMVDDDLTGLVLVEDVIHAGKKKTYTVTTETGKQTRTTEDHMFLTDSGFTALGDLEAGMTVTCKSDKQWSGIKKVKRPYDKAISGQFFNTPYYVSSVSKITGKESVRVREHRAVYDAALNGVSLNEFIQELRTNENHNFIFSDKDGNHQNNDPANLEALTNSEHEKQHANEVQQEKIVSIVFFGEEETYDVVCAEPYNNFIADGFVTHNSGKTFFNLYIARHAWYMQKKPVLFVSMEMNILSIQQRLTSMHTKHNLNHLKTAKLSTKSHDSMIMQLQGNADEHYSLWVVDGNLTATVEDIWKICMQVNPALVVVDGAYLIKHPNPRLNKFDRVSENAELLKQHLAASLDIPCLCSWQFNREATKKMEKNKDAKAGLEDIGSSDSIGQLSSVVLGLLQSESVETLMTREIDVLKGRSGEVGSFKTKWDFVNMDFSQIELEGYNGHSDYDEHELIIE